MHLDLWARKWGVNPAAMEELRRLLIVDTGVPVIDGESESAVQSRVRLEGAQKGIQLWRNNVGAGKLENGQFVRWGLCNDSKQMNEKVKSSDLIGIRKITIKQIHVGQILGQFVARETKAADWKYSGIDRERAQLRFIEMVLSMGGDAAFASGEGTL